MRAGFWRFSFGAKVGEMVFENSTFFPLLWVFEEPQFLFNGNIQKLSIYGNVKSLQWASWLTAFKTVSALAGCKSWSITQLHWSEATLPRGNNWRNIGWVSKTCLMDTTRIISHFAVGYKYSYCIPCKTDCSSEVPQKLWQFAEFGNIPRFHCLTIFMQTSISLKDSPSLLNGIDC